MILETEEPEKDVVVVVVDSGQLEVYAQSFPKQ
jgi:hypothetical protein